MSLSFLSLPLPLYFVHTESDAVYTMVSSVHTESDAIIVQDSRGSRLVEPGGGEALASPTPGDTRLFQLSPANILACYTAAK